NDRGLSVQVSWNPHMWVAVVGEDWEKGAVVLWLERPFQTIQDMPSDASRAQNLALQLAAEPAGSGEAWVEM
ncbi:hypothetical protein A235_05253, partial [Pseudomonas syringae pv. actinidiae ICMP 19079]